VERPKEPAFLASPVVAELEVVLAFRLLEPSEE
jgi:hypothetical protein